MAETVTTSDGSYTWAAATFAWNSPTASSTQFTPSAIIWSEASMTWNSPTAGAKSWAAAYYASFTVDVNCTLDFIEGLGKATSKPFSESLAISESGSRVTDFARAFSEAIATAEGYDDVVAFSRTFSSSVAIAEQVEMQYVQALSEALAFVESPLLQTDFVRQVSESIVTSESYSDVVAFARNFSDTLAIAEQTNKSYAQAIAEAVAIVETPLLEALYLLQFSEAFALTSGGYDWTESGFAWNATPDAWAMYANATKNVSAFKSSSLAISDSQSSAATFARNLAETLAIATSPSKAATTLLSDAFGISDSAGTITSFDRAFAEAVAVAEGVAKGYAQSLTDSFSVSDATAKQTDKALFESVAFAETLGRVATYSRALSEGIGLSDAVAKAVALSKEDAFSIGDELRRNSDAVISDILIGTSDIDETQFQTLLDQATATGYGAFVPFAEGDHTYQSAIIKATFASVSARLRLNKLDVRVDVPDTFESGVVFVPSTGVTVNLTRNFTEPPEINASIKSGVGFMVPRIRDIALDSFVLEVFDASNSLISANVSWAAHGY